eukprot:gnl/Spiro4/18580_TR9964_c0_g1_i1.p1 gnl/Spiro4/18580_TR9964_c0_g1~~gnl/Spiro4/18580_TR9964_c0_g1_i1.p1  ORF type:complete len:222 (-),score=25.67 gnl/Spiro4/18580_TR9964_c0_g1_i1:221-817(-)
MGVLVGVALSGIAVALYTWWQRRRAEQSYASLDHVALSSSVSIPNASLPPPAIVPVPNTLPRTDDGSGDRFHYPRDPGVKLELDPAPSQPSTSEFSDLWSQYTYSDTWSTFLDTKPTLEMLEEALSQSHIFIIASGLVDDKQKLKLYMFGQQKLAGDILLAEAIMVLSTSTITAKFKASRPQFLSEFVTVFEHAIKSL